uniref:Uncharacterized protein n=1 Tax=Kalanchoe fedtschenkoi TaxID=63787 RepID=A0A7N0TKU6_KALFE
MVDSMTSKDAENNSRPLLTVESQAPSMDFISRTVNMENGDEEPEVVAITSKGKRKMKPRSKAWNYFKKIWSVFHLTESKCIWTKVCCYCRQLSWYAKLLFVAEA